MKYLVPSQKHSLEQLDKEQSDWSLKSENHSEQTRIYPRNYCVAHNGWSEILDVYEAHSVHQFNFSFQSSQKNLRDRLEFLELKVEKLEKAQSLLLIEDSPIFEGLFKSSSRSDQKRIIYITEKLIENKKYVMLGRMLSEIDKQSAAPSAIDTLMRTLKIHKSDKKLSEMILGLLESKSNLPDN
jgi:hypothetical protein